MKPLNTFLSILVCILMFLAGTFAGALYQENRSKETTETDFVEFNQDSIQDHIVSIEDYLQFRKEMIETDRKDSVFKAMPEIALVNILYNFGTELSQYEIVNIYESNTAAYNKILEGAKTKEIVDSLNNIDVHSNSTKRENIIPKVSL
ncbi:hypothetical protein [Intestinibacter sp.]|uniref:hypothetical protein n=1 Tax=Intestinibacter sp. TaxID=1965304 RepID=UPI003F17B7E0